MIMKSRLKPAQRYLKTLRGAECENASPPRPKGIWPSALGAFGHPGIFQHYHSSGEVKTGKDNPLIYQRAFEHLGAPLTKTVIFEDALHAIETATAAGFSGSRRL